VHALRGISFDVQQGERFGIVGESGCGKSTLLRILAGLDQPTSGSVMIDGTDISRLPERKLAFLRERLQMVFQDPMSSLDPRMRVRDIIAEPLVAQRIGGRQERVAELLDAVGLQPDAADRFPHQFSGGQRQRISIARALALDPELLFLDEPTAGLDPVSAAGVDDLVLKLRDLFGLTIVMITHDLDLLWQVADRVAVLDAGKVQETGSMVELSRSGNPAVRVFFDGPRGRAAAEQGRAGTPPRGTSGERSSNPR